MFLIFLLKESFSFLLVFKFVGMYFVIFLITHFVFKKEFGESFLA
jgi:hypothetical protein